MKYAHVLIFFFPFFSGSANTAISSRAIHTSSFTLTKRCRSFALYERHRDFSFHFLNQYLNLLIISLFPLCVCFFCFPFWFVVRRCAGSKGGVHHLLLAGQPFHPGWEGCLCPSDHKARWGIGGESSSGIYIFNIFTSSSSSTSTTTASAATIIITMVNPGLRLRIFALLHLVV